MICRVDGTVYRGRVVTLPDAIDPETVATAVREGTAEGNPAVTVTARTPHPAHERVGCLSPDISVRIRTALAAAARARGYGTRYDRRLRDARARLADFDPDTGSDAIDTTELRREVASADDDTGQLRERVATIRGRLQTRREAGQETTSVREELVAAARELSEVETSASAARQQLDRKRREARHVRDALAERLRLEDRVANVERQARAALVERVENAYATAVADVPGGPDDPSDPFDVDALTAGLAVARIANFDAPVVLSCDRFPSARAASRWLGAPVLEV